MLKGMMNCALGAKKQGEIAIVDLYKYKICPIVTNCKTCFKMVFNPNSNFNC